MEDSFEAGIRRALEADRRLLFAAVPDQERNLCRPRQAGPNARGHRAEGRMHGRDARNLRLSQPRVRDHERSRTGRNGVRHGRRLRKLKAPERPSADLQLSLGLLRLSGLELRRDQRRSGAQPLWGGAGPPVSGRNRLRGRDPRFRHRTRPGLRHRGPGAFQAALRQIHAHLGAKLHAAESGRPRPCRAHEAHPHQGADRRDRRFLFCEDSIVRGTQLKDTIQRLYDVGAREVHMRPACPPLGYGCKFLNFSRSRSEMDLAARQAIRAIEGPDAKDPSEYARAGTDKVRGHGRIDPETAEPDHAQVPTSGRPDRGHRPAERKALHLLLGWGGIAAFFKIFP